MWFVNCINIHKSGCNGGETDGTSGFADAQLFYTCDLSSLEVAF